MKSILFTNVLLLSFLLNSVFVYGQKIKQFPYSSEGLSKKEAAIHLLSRFTYGYDEQDVTNILNQGLENWFMKQLEGNENENALYKALKPYGDVLLPNKQLADLYPRTVFVRQQMIKEGYISKDSVQEGSEFYKTAFNEYSKDKGYKPERQLYRDFVASKILRASLAVNQVQEVMTDFWFNHFNVSLSKPQSAPFVPSYENHVIRPHALGRFEELLIATAKSPAMLLYLDNATSSGNNPKAKNRSGINENYARELMELHTLGVDGGYTQEDVSEAARILTGWTIFPMNGYGNVGALNNPNAIIDGDFVFLRNRHDKGVKNVLGYTFSDEGMNEGLKLLSILANHKETAHFIAKKMAIRFVCDSPSIALIETIAKSFLQSKGDVKTILRCMVYTKEFWKKDNINEKIKTPFELAISSIRALDAQVTNPNKVVNWVTRMGEHKYYYTAPTGFPDQSAYWINTGALLNRMNFGLSFVTEKSSGVDVNLLRFLNHQDPESTQQALTQFAQKMVPMANSHKLIERLSPLLTSENIKMSMQEYPAVITSLGIENDAKQLQRSLQDLNNNILQQVLGLIIGSPEFQRR